MDTSTCLCSRRRACGGTTGPLFMDQCSIHLSRVSRIPDDGDDDDDVSSRATGYTYPGLLACSNQETARRRKCLYATGRLFASRLTLSVFSARAWTTSNVLLMSPDVPEVCRADFSRHGRRVLQGSRYHGRSERTAVN